jgi:hypothetical protein
MALTPIGLNVPAGTDAFDPQVDLGDLATSLIGRTVVPVANLTARAALATAVGPTASKPLVVFRADAPIYKAIEYTTNGSTWYALAELATLPDSVTVVGSSSNIIVATSGFTNLPADLFTTLTLTRPAWVFVAFSGWLVKTAASDLRAGVNITGATTSAESDPTWSQVLYSGANSTAFGGTVTATKTLKFGAGTTTVRMRAYLAAAGGTNSINYPRISLTPLRWSD